MAAGVLEKKETKNYFDDTTPLTAVITTHRVLSSHAEYIVRVHRGPNPDDNWEVAHRYSDFANLQAALQPSGVPLPLPPKKMFGNTDRQFLVERQTQLQQYLGAILKDPLLSSYFEVKRFLDPQNYSVSFSELALRNVSMFFRSEPSWSVVEPLKDIGWRVRKQYYLIKSKANDKIPAHLLTWCEPGPDFTLGDKELEAAFKVLMDIKHPFILSPVTASYNGSGMMIVRQFNRAGSLRDVIYNTKPELSVLTKYGSPSRSSSLSVADIRRYGRQVLEALSFLAEKGYVLGHIHAGNVLVMGGVCKLVDIENSLLGLPLFLRPLLVELRKIHSQPAECVYSFGHMLYEMCAGQPLKTVTFEELPPNFPQAAIPVLSLMLTARAIKDGLPTVADLIANPFFSEANGISGDKPYIKVSSKLREVLKAHITRAEGRLHDEQRKVSQFRRLSKAHESLMSEDERKKRRKQRKKQMSLQETDEPAAYPTTTSLPRQNTISTSTPSTTAAAKPKSPATSATASAQSSKQPASKSTSKAPPPPSASPPAPRAAPPPSDSSRGALLDSIHTFAKGKLKKAVTKDRSSPFVRK